ncbi:AAA family protein [Mycena kentingensis (nom. inval.)]|nr:AAA family protein [Mycena kentingensis (nom. inval.)]
MAGKRKNAVLSAKQKSVTDFFKKPPPTAPKEIIEIFDELPPPAPVIDLTLESPPKSILPPPPPRETYSIFKKRVPKTVMDNPRPWLDSEPVLTRENQHVRATQTAFFAPPHPFPLRSTLPQPSTSSSSTLPCLLDSPAPSGVQMASTAHGPLSLEQRQTYLHTIPVEHKETHSAIKGLSSLALDDDPSSEQQWSDRWHPRCAEDVLGNHENAAYLRDWLKALELRPDPTLDGPRGVKRPNIVRAVTRAKKRRRDDDGWIVSDASDYSSDHEMPEGDDDDDFDLPDAPTPRANLFGKHLTNTILLHGPSGVGKTAAVYACAEELDWEVFEVNPGIGRRNSASLDALIGEVGKNHLVRKSQLGFRRRDDEAVDFGFKFNASARQSVILLEEVDILYKEDSNFWSAVVRLISESRRPVILTCNDASLVPSDTLPLQTTLGFHACPTDAAASYLQALCCAEGHLFDRERLVDLYAETMDLRHTIQQLQLNFQTSSTCADLELLPDWNTCRPRDASYAETISFADAYLERNGIPTALPAATMKPSDNEELGHLILTSKHEDCDALDEEYEFGAYKWDKEIVASMAAVSQTRRVGGARVDGGYAELIDVLKMREHEVLPVGILRSELHLDGGTLAGPTGDKEQ